MTRENPLAFLDIETTGLNPMLHDVLEVAYVIDDGNALLETHFALQIWEKNADAKALEINRYSERRDALSQIEISTMQAVKQLEGELKGAIIVGANPQFDIAFLRQFLWRHAHSEPTWHYRSIDLNTLAAGWVGDPLPMSTADIAAEFKVPLGDEQHTALADARWNQQAYQAIIESDPCGG